MENKIKNLIFYALLFTIIGDVTESVGNKLNLNALELLGISKLISCVCLIRYSIKVKWTQQIPLFAYRVFRIIIFINIITIIRGAILSKDYWDWKFLIFINSFSLLIPYSMLAGVMFIHNVRGIRFTFKKYFIYGLLLIPLAATKFNIYSKLMVPISLYTLFGGYFKRKWLIIILLVAVCSVITDIEFRANVIRVTVPVLLSSCYMFRSFIKVSFLRIICFVIFLAPFVFLYLGVAGQFNVFKPFEGSAASNSASSDVGDLSVDTRTGLYQEVFLSMGKRKSFLFGEGGTAKYQSIVFDSLGDGRGRYGAEVGFLNTLLYSGIIGVLAYLLVLITACYYAMNFSNNYVSKLIAVFIAFRWVMFFMEDIPKYDLNFFFLWIAIGLCFSNSFRSLSDVQIKVFFRQILAPKKIKIPAVVN